jgi:hypothetical protein
VNAKLKKQLRQRKRKIEKRLSAEGMPPPHVFRRQNVHYELAERTRGIAYGGIGAMHALAHESGLVKAIDRRLSLLKMHRPYTEADHVLNIAFNMLCDGTCLEDIELRRNDEVFLDALGAARIPDPTTAGDFCRRFGEDSVRELQTAINEARLQVWARQPRKFFERATIDMDGSLVPTCGECKQGMDIAYNGVWGYHPLVVSLAETNEVLSIINRSGNRPSHEGAAREADAAIALCRAAGFLAIRLRGDTDFSQTRHLDRWDDAGVEFLFGLDVTAAGHVLADDLVASAWSALERPPRDEPKNIEAKTTRARPENVKEKVVIARRFTNIRLVSEDVAECDYQPAACRKRYRLIIVRKNLEVSEPKQGRLFDDYRYFSYITNVREAAADRLVLVANARCNQENLISQLKSGVRALHAPVNSLVANGAYMVMAALAWNLKAWSALWLPARSARQRHEKVRLLRMEFRTFVNAFLRVPAQIARTGRRLMFRLLAWNPWSPIFFRLTDALRLCDQRGAK